MKKIKIAHLYYDLMNLYGEVGNIYALEKSLKMQDLEVEIVNISYNEEINFDEYNIIYIGAGNENNLELSRKALIKYKDKFKEYIKNNILITTGNSFSLFGKTIDNLESINLFDYETKLEKNRIIGEVSFKNNNNLIIGFQNRIHSSTLYNETNLLALFNNNFYGSYLIGPLLVRNPYLLIEITKKLCSNINIEYKDINLDIELKAYENYIKNFNL